MYCSGQYFADDVALVSGDGVGLQHQLNALSDVLAVEGLDISIAKTKVMCVQPNRGAARGAPLSLGGELIEEVDEFKYLGTMLVNDLSWHCHVDGVCNASSRASTRLRSMGGKSLPTEILKQAHMALVVPHAENAAALWAHGIVNVPELDKGERCALGWILGSTARMPEIVVRGELGMRAPQSRREAALLRLYFNLLSGRTLGLGKMCLSSGLREYMKLVLARRVRPPPRASKSWLAQVHRTLWRHGKCRQHEQDSMDQAGSLWIGDGLVQQDMGGDGEWGDDAFDAASNASWKE